MGALKHLTSSVVGGGDHMTAGLRSTIARSLEAGSGALIRQMTQVH